MGTKYLRQGTAAVITFGPCVDAADGVTPETGLVSAFDHAGTGIMLSKNGGALTIRHATVTATAHDARGNYRVTLDATDTDTCGRLRVEHADAAMCPVWEEFAVLPAQVYDSLILGTDLLDANASQAGGTTQTGRDLGASVLVGDKTGFSLATAPPTAADIATAVWASAARTLTAATNLTADIATAVWAAATRTLTAAADSSGVTTLLSRIAAALTITGGKVDVNDKTGFAPSTSDIDTALSTAHGAAAWGSGTTPPSAVEIRQEMDTNSTKLVFLDAAITSRPNQAGIRTALGLASANLDTQLGALMPASGYTAPDNAGIGAAAGAAASAATALATMAPANVFTPEALANAPTGGGGGASVQDIAASDWGKVVAKRRDMYPCGGWTGVAANGVLPLLRQGSIPADASVRIYWKGWDDVEGSIWKLMLSKPRAGDAVPNSDPPEVYDGLTWVHDPYAVDPGGSPYPTAFPVPDYAYLQLSVYPGATDVPEFLISIFPEPITAADCGHNAIYVPACPSGNNYHSFVRGDGMAVIPYGAAGSNGDWSGTTAIKAAIASVAAAGSGITPEQYAALAKESTVLGQFGVTYGITYPQVRRDGVISLTRGDVATVSFTLGAAFPLAGKKVYFCAQKRRAADNATAIVNRVATITDEATRACSITLTAAELATAGQYLYEIEVRNTDESAPATAEAGTMNVIDDLRK